MRNSDQMTIGKARPTLEYRIPIRNQNVILDLWNKSSYEPRSLVRFNEVTSRKRFLLYFVQFSHGQVCRPMRHGQGYSFYWPNPGIAWSARTNFSVSGSLTPPYPTSRFQKVTLTFSPSMIFIIVINSFLVELILFAASVKILLVQKSPNVPLVDKHFGKLDVTCTQDWTSCHRSLADFLL